MKLSIDISKDRYDEIMSMDWKNCRRFFDEEIRAIHDGKVIEQEPCEDAISRQAAIDAADKIIERDTSGSNAVVNAMIAWSVYIKGLPPVTPAENTNRWIPVSEGLPKDKQKVIFTNKKNEIGLGIYHKRIGFLSDDVIAWMPFLLEPYKASPAGGESAEWVDDKCSACGKGIEDLIYSYEWYQNENPKYCPFCGIKIQPHTEREE